MPKVAKAATCLQYPYRWPPWPSCIPSGSRSIPIPSLVTAWYRLSQRVYTLAWRLFRPTTIGVKLILTAPDGRILLVKPRYQETWTLPGGGVYKRETPENAAVRELVEETGVVIPANDLRLLGLLSNFAEGKSDYVAVFQAQLMTPATSRPAGEIEAAAFFAPDSLPPTTSPATMRRLTERASGSPMHGAW